MVDYAGVGEFQAQVSPDVIYAFFGCHLHCFIPPANLFPLSGKAKKTYELPIKTRTQQGLKLVDDAVMCSARLIAPLYIDSTNS
jgi:hypothetical protein